MKRLLAVTLFLAIAVSPDARAGFGFKKKAVDIDRTVPPATNAGARRVGLKVESERGADQDDARTLERYISEFILAGGGTVAESKSEVNVDVVIDRLESHESWETYTDYETQQTGTKQEWNEKKKKYETKPVYSTVSVQKQRKVVDARLGGTYDISAKNKDIASGPLDETFRETYTDGASSPSPMTVEDNLMKRAGKKVAAQLVPTTERVSVLLPRGDFERLIPLAESGQWDRYLEAVEAMPAHRKQKEEAYRHYALAIAKEAVAYKKENRNEALDLLRAAQSHYETAAALNTDEELFRKGYTSLLSTSTIGSPMARASESVTRYAAWSGGTGGGAVRVASTTPVAGPSSSTSKASSSSSPSSSSSAKAAMRNQTVIDLAKAGLSDENIILAIDGAASTQFDVSPEGLIALAKGGVSKGVIAHMQKKSRR